MCRELHTTLLPELFFNAAHLRAAFFMVRCKSHGYWLVEALRIPLVSRLSRGVIFQIFFRSKKRIISTGRGGVLRRKNVLKFGFTKFNTFVLSILIKKRLYI